ncbi:MAG TPA: NADPH-dependent FMN reductase [Casimicrobiaceae bacterium]|nr:NADPH-dependent FMN reductase [Casimicrobiaceae bacterium]
MPAATVAVLIGSLRRDSINRKMANALIAMQPASLAMSIVEIAQLPPFNADDEANPPKEVTEFKKKVESFDAVLFVTPEYNRSMPGVLKNAIDVGSRPYGKNSWQGKPGAVVSVSPGAIGGFGANHHLRQSMVFLNVPMMQQPEAYIGNGAKLFDDKGGFSNDSTRELMEKLLQSFAQWIERNRAR